MYERQLARLNYLTRMALVGLIHNRCLTIKDGVIDDSAAVTLMSNDTEDGAQFGDLLHEVWSQVLELCIGMYMLAEELGWVCIVPLLVVLCKTRRYSRFTRIARDLCLHGLGISQAVKFITTDLVDRQSAFSMATQMRISTTKAILDSMKNVKTMGLVERMEAKIQTAREREMMHYIAFHRLLVAFFVSCKLLLVCLTPGRYRL